MIEDTLRPGFADELLARLERARRPFLRTGPGRTIAGAALSASVALLFAARRRAR